MCAPRLDAECLTPVAQQPDMMLPKGFWYAKGGEAFSPMSDGTPAPPAHDAMGVFRVGAKYHLVRNHELDPEDFGFVPPLPAGSKAYDRLVRDLSTPENAQARTIAEIIRRTRPDVLLINEFDHVEGGLAARLFQQNSLSVSQNGARPIHYGYSFVAPSNTGIPSGFDLNNNGSVGGPDDAFGFGAFPGQLGMAVYSRFPIAYDDIRTGQRFLWKDMPGALLPDDPATPQPADWYSSEELEVFRLSSKSHWDVPIRIGAKVVHFLVSHPTLRCSTVPKTATARATSMKSGSGPTTCCRPRANTSPTTRDGPAASSLAPCS
ncbi:MAG: endonuclease/exonuclease/phosphatase family protein [Vicinamibacterales bacterium]